MEKTNKVRNKFIRTLGINEQMPSIQTFMTSFDVKANLFVFATSCKPPRLMQKQDLTLKAQSALLTALGKS